MKFKWEYSTYLTMSLGEQEFQQKLLFFEYVEDAAEQSTRDERYRTLNEAFTTDWKYYEDREKYETCALYKATHDRFKKQFLDIE